MGLADALRRGWLILRRTSTTTPPARKRPGGNNDDDDGQDCKNDQEGPRGLPVVHLPGVASGRTAVREEKGERGRDRRETLCHDGGYSHSNPRRS